MTDHLVNGTRGQGADAHEMARQLNSHLGPTLVVALADGTSKEQALEWGQPDGPEPSADAARRLELAHHVWTEVAAAEGDDVARAWLTGGNPLLGEDTPVNAIRERRATEVMAAVRALIEGGSDV